MNLSNRSFAYVDPWLKTAYWVTFLMSWMGVPLVTRWWGLQAFSDAAVLLSTQIAFVGAVTYPLTAFTMWRRGEWLDSKQWQCVWGSTCVAVLFGAWLGQLLFTWAMLTIIFSSAALITLIAAARVLWQVRTT